MKKFKFQLDTVLGYKRQELDARMNEYGAAVEQSNLQQQLIFRLTQSFSDYNAEYREKMSEGLTAAEALKFQNCLDAMTRQIEKETERLAELREFEEKKRLEVVAARQETASLEKLEEIKRKEYDDALLKAEEKEIDDLIAARSANAG